MLLKTPKGVRIIFPNIDTLKGHWLLKYWHLRLYNNVYLDKGWYYEWTALYN